MLLFVGQFTYQILSRAPNNKGLSLMELLQEAPIVGVSLNPYIGRIVMTLTQ